VTELWCRMQEAYAHYMQRLAWKCGTWRLRPDQSNPKILTVAVGLSPRILSRCRPKTPFSLSRWPAKAGRPAKALWKQPVEASQIRFRPILMTSFTFILGVLPLVLASGAGASARKSLGLAVATGMLASTRLAVLFVPAFYVVLQRWVERKPVATGRT